VAWAVFYRGDPVKIISHHWPHEVLQGQHSIFDLLHHFFKAGMLHGRAGAFVESGTTCARVSEQTMTRTGQDLIHVCGPQSLLTLTFLSKQTEFPEEISEGVPHIVHEALALLRSQVGVANLQKRRHEGCHGRGPA